MSKILCHCDLSGSIHVIELGKGCNICDGFGVDFNEENVEKALQYLADRPVPNYKERDRCAKAICAMCAEGRPLNEHGDHVSKPGAGGILLPDGHCLAWAIHQMPKEASNS